MSFSWQTQCFVCQGALLPFAALLSHCCPLHDFYLFLYFEWRAKSSHLLCGISTINLIFLCYINYLLLCNEISQNPFSLRNCLAVTIIMYFLLACFFRGSGFQWVLSGVFQNTRAFSRVVKEKLPGVLYPNARLLPSWYKYSWWLVSYYIQCKHQ